MKPALCSRFHPALLISFLCFCSVLTGCVGATRLPTRSLGSGGAKIPQKELDLNFLQVGVTQRDEVAHQLAAVDTAYSNPRLFWGRWSESRWGYWWIVGMPCNNCMAGDANRKWHAKNLLVVFDQKGAVATKETVGDDRVWAALHSRLLEAQSPPLDFSQPVRVSLANADPTAILLTRDSMEFERGPKRNQVNVQIPVTQVVRFAHRRMDNKNSPSMTCHALEFSEKTAFGKKVKFCAEASQIGMLFEYLQETGPPSMKWE